MDFGFVAAVGDDENGVGIHGGGGLEHADEARGAGDGFFGNLDASTGHPFIPNPIEGEGFVWLAGWHEFFAERLIVARILDDAEARGDRELADEGDQFLAEFFRRDSGFGGFVHHGSGDIDHQQYPLTAGIDSKKAQAFSSKPAATARGGSGGGSESLGVRDRGHLIGQKLRGVEGEHLVERHVRHIGEGEGGRSGALHLIAQRGLGRDGIEGGHVHLLFALFCRQADVFFHHEIGGGREDVFGDDENAGDDSGCHMKQQDTDEDGNNHPDAAFFGAGVFAE